jgi:hypothetical protein
MFPANEDKRQSATLKIKEKKYEASAISTPSLYLMHKNYRVSCAKTKLNSYDV